MKTKKIPLSIAKELGENYNKHQIIIFAYDEVTGATTLTSWGKKTHKLVVIKSGDKPKVKKTAKKTAKSRRKTVSDFMRLLQPSEALSAITGPKPLSRPDVVKKLWAYIQKNGLQDKKNRRMINSDERLKPIFSNKEQVSMFELAKLLSKHVTDIKK